MHTAPRLTEQYTDEAPPASELYANLEAGKKLDVLVKGFWHRVWERKPLKFTILVFLAIAVASLFEIIPTFVIGSNIPTIASVQPYTPLELAGRDIYVAEGCYGCHSQMIRPLYAETKRYGEYSKPGEFVYDHPFQWGSKRTGPDLHREGGRQSDSWHVLHFNNPRQVNDRSIMPAYPHMLTKTIDFDGLTARVRVMAMLGVPYGPAVLDGKAPEMAREQAAAIAKSIVTQGGQADLGDKQVVALIAYMQRLGTDISKPAPVPAPAAKMAQADSPAAPAKPQ